jgi:hypothetical protein
MACHAAAACVAWLGQTDRHDGRTDMPAHVMWLLGSDTVTQTLRLMHALLGLGRAGPEAAGGLSGALPRLHVLVRVDRDGHAHRRRRSWPRRLELDRPGPFGAGRTRRRPVKAPSEGALAAAVWS